MKMTFKAVKWYRESTSSWILELHVNIPPKLCATYRYSHKYEMLLWFKFIWDGGFITVVKDILK